MAMTVNNVIPTAAAATKYAAIPTNLTPEQKGYQTNLLGQVKTKGISQGQYEAEMRRYLGLDGSTPAAPAAPATPVAPTPEQTLATDTTGSITSNLRDLLTPKTQPPIYGDQNGLFPNVRAFEPKNYEGSPLYQFQRDQGLKALRGTLSARGLTGSGAELEAQNRFMNQLGAQEADRAGNVAQTEADRLERMQQNEALRLERGEGNQFNRVYQVLQLLQAQNPAEYAYQGARTQADIEIEKAKLMADYQSRLIAPASGGGGGVPGAGDPGPYIPNAAGGPDFSGLDRASAAAAAASNANNYKQITNIISSFLR